MLARIRLALLLVAAGLGASDLAAAERVLSLSLGGETRRITATEMLARPDVAFVTVANDPSYKRAMTYRAVPLLALLAHDLQGVDTLEARASDGFVAQIPASVVAGGAAGGAVAWVAIEDEAAPWPPLPNKGVSGGPFYLVWAHADGSAFDGNEYWPYMLVAITAVENPLRRWPQLAVDPALPEDAPERLGQASFLKHCIACHRMKGAGEGDVGPDLGQPMHVTQYMTHAGIRALVRDPKSVRTWPEQRMSGFDTKALPDAELDALISFFAHMATR